jgi:sodium/potassium-transporting ATPase subunit alpha
MTVQKVCYDNSLYTAMDTAFGPATVNAVSGTYEPFLRCAVVCNTAEFDEASKFGSKVENGEKVIDRSQPIEFERIMEVGGQTEARVQWKTNGDATESALIKFAQHTGIDVSDYRAGFKEVAKIPFNSKNKFMVVISDYPQDKLREGEDSAFLLTMKGAPERVINRCSHVMFDGEVREMTPEYLAQIDSLQTQCSKQGLRVLGFAEKALSREDYPADYRFVTENPNFPMGADLSQNTNKAVVKHKRSEEQLVFLGLYALIDPPRPQVRPAVAKCKTAGIRVIMVTGDHPITAKAIARQVGIIWGDAARGGDAHGPATQEDYEEWNAERGLSPENRINENNETYFDPRVAPAIVVPGWEILPDDCHMGNSSPTIDPKTDATCVPKEKWDDILAHTQIVFARTSPQQKLIIVENCKMRGEVVAVTGDGVNDAPALRKAHIGVAMGIMGSDVSKEAADMILLDDNFASIVQGVEEGRLIFDNLKKSIAYTLSSNIPEIAPFLCFITLNIPLPLSTVLILFVDLGTDMIPAISMAWENAESDIMRRPPRDSEKDHLVTKKLIFFAYLQIGVVQALAGFFTYIVVLGDYGYPAEILRDTGFDWGLQTIWCKTKGGRFVNQNFDPDLYDTHEPGTSTNSATEWDSQHPIWWGGDDGEIEDCAFAAKDIRGNANNYDQAHPGNEECQE